MHGFDCRLDEELKRLKQARNTNEQRLKEAQGITRTVQAACQVQAQLTYACLLLLNRFMPCILMQPGLWLPFASLTQGHCAPSMRCANRLGHLYMMSLFTYVCCIDCGAAAGQREAGSV